MIRLTSRTFRSTTGYHAAHLPLYETHKISDAHRGLERHPAGKQVFHGAGDIGFAQPRERVVESQVRAQEAVRQGIQGW